MIYNQGLTDSLTELFEEDVSNWSKAVIRTKLEEALTNSKNAVLDTEVCDEDARQIYKYVNNLHDEFMTLYTEELDVQAV